MKISDAFLKIQIGANLTPQSPNISGPTHVGSEYLSLPSDIKAVLVARLFFSVVSHFATFTAATGGFALSPSGARKIISRTINAAAGVSGPGTLSVFFRHAQVNSGADFYMLVPLNPTDHYNSESVTKAIAAKVRTYAQITEKFTVTTQANVITLTSIYAYANDVTAIFSLGADALGVSALVGSASSATAGVIVDRSGANLKDIFGAPWSVENGHITDIRLACVTGRVTASNTAPSLRSGQVAAWSDLDGVSELGTEVFTCDESPAILDVIALCK